MKEKSPNKYSAKVMQTTHACSASNLSTLGCHEDEKTQCLWNTTVSKHSDNNELPHAILKNKRMSLTL